MSKNSKATGLIIILSILTFSVSATTYAESVAYVGFSDSSIHLSPVAELSKITVTITRDDGIIFFSKHLSSESLTILLSEIGVVYNGFYIIHLSAETRNVKEIEETGENGREAKTYHLKAILTQSKPFQILNNKILLDDIIEN